MVSKNTNVSVKRSRKKSSVDQALAAPQQLANSNGSAPSNAETLRNLYASLLRCRLIEDRIQGLPLPRAVGDKYDFVVGHEGVPVATAAALVPGDTIAASQRNLMALVMAGVPSRQLLSDAGRPEACGCNSAGLLTFTSLSQDPFNAGTGIALAHKLEKKQHVVVAFGCEEAPSLEGWREALKLAGSGRLPIIYVVKNSTGDGGAYAPHLKPVSLLARDGGFPGVIVDGQDAVAVWRVAQESIHRARNGGGPTLIDCRMDAGRDPLAQMEHYLRKRSLWDEEWRQRVAAQINAELEGSAS
jgi:TPP-dependent pyruvate/acetoin dehydrogenase alpha subunit